MEEYRMVKHLFGATSSPSVANFCLRKTAQLYQEEFDAEVVETVKRNMHHREGCRFSQSVAQIARERWIPFDKVVQ